MAGARVIAVLTARGLGLMVAALLLTLMVGVAGTAQAQTDEAGTGATSASTDHRGTRADARRTVRDLVSPRRQDRADGAGSVRRDRPLERTLDRLRATHRRAAATVSEDTDRLAPRRRVPLVNRIGSAVFDFVGAALRIVDGPPAVPRGSSVTVRTSTLDMPGTGKTVQADWYLPENADSATRLIYLQHGFMATGPMYSYTAAYLAEHTNSIVVAPTLSSNLFDPDARWLGGEPMQQSVADLFAGDRAELTASASAAIGRPVTLPQSFVLVGHSLGGALVMGAAGRMTGNGAVSSLAGVVLLDAVDVNDSTPAGLQQLSGDNHRPVYNISSERYVWNKFGLVGDQLSAARPNEFTGVMLMNGRHIDALQGPNALLQFAEHLVAGFSQPVNIDAVQVISAGWINDMFARAADGLYGDPQEHLHFLTPGGVATAVVFPFESRDSVLGTPWDGTADDILNGLFRFAVYTPL